MKSHITVKSRPLIVGVCLLLFLPGTLFAKVVTKTALKRAAGIQVQVFAIGNTDMSTQLLTGSSRGWMQMLPMFFSPDIRFINHSDDSLSLTAFIRNNGLTAIDAALQPGDYVLISFREIEQAACFGSSTDGVMAALNKLLFHIKKRKAVAIIVCAPSAKTCLQKVINKTSQTGIISTQLPAITAPGRLPAALSVYQAIQTADTIAKLIRAKYPDLVAKAEQMAIDREDRKTDRTLLNSKANNDLIARQLRAEAGVEGSHRHILQTGEAAAKTATALRSKLMALCGAKAYPNLPVSIKETGVIKRDGFEIRKLYFQTRPGIYATANLYVPDGKGPFPAVINMHGHWPDGKAGEMVQACAISLAQNGFVCLNIDAWGAGERTTLQNVPEYHGSNLGASLMNVGQSLLGMQVTDNMRGVDLLCSLPYVDPARIGATGASGGGNQTMWLSALDTRIKACMPVVSVGTFHSYIMGSNCVCELMPEGLQVATESDVLSLIAPRFIKICSGLQDANPTFSPSQMLISYRAAMPYFKSLAAANHLKYQLFNTPHGYWPEIRSAMLGWFSSVLKTGKHSDFLPEKPVDLLPPGDLLVFGAQPRSPLIATTLSYCEKAGAVLRDSTSILLGSPSALAVKAKRAALKKLLLMRRQNSDIKTHYELVDKISHTANATQTGWQNGVLSLGQYSRIPLSILPAEQAGAPILIICPPDSAAGVEQGQDYVKHYIRQYFNHGMDSLRKKGYTLVIADLWGIGQAGSPAARQTNGALPLFHTTARADLWLGHTVMGEWVQQLHLLTSFLKEKYATSTVALMAGKEVSVAALCTGAIYADFSQLYLDQLPVSYVLDKRAGIDFFNMAVHIPAILNWGDVNLMAALNHQAEIRIMSPVTITGKRLTGEALKHIRETFLQKNKALEQKNVITFDSL